MTRFIAIAGNIGAGKSSLTRLLAEKLGWTAFYEPVDDNPYLADFYENMSEWAFHSQVFFLAGRLQQYRAILDDPKSVIQDRSVYEDAEIFARNLYQQGYMNDRDWRSYCELYEGVTAVLPPPDLIVYLQTSVSTLTERISQRGRNFEHTIPGTYLEQLNTLYDQWIDGFTLCPVLTVDTDAVDFVQEERYLEQIIDDIYRNVEQI